MFDAISMSCILYKLTRSSYVFQFSQVNICEMFCVNKF